MNVSLYQAASAMNASSRWQEVISENMAAGELKGYKKRDLSFSAVQAGLAANGTSASNYVIPRGTLSVNFQPGEVRATGSKTDLAIVGMGFFEVRMPDGSLAYTRNGEFHVNGQGQISTKEGYLVMGDKGPVQLDTGNSDPVAIAASGEITQGDSPIGKIKLVQFDRPQLLQAASRGLFLANDPSLIAKPATAASLQQGYLESSNVSPVVEMANLLTAMRLFESNQKVFQSQDERVEKAIRELTANV